MRLATRALAWGDPRQQHDVCTIARATSSTKLRLTARTSTRTDQAPSRIHSIHRPDDDQQTSPDEGRSTNRAGIPMPPARPSASSRPEIREAETLRIRPIDHRIGLRHAA